MNGWDTFATTRYLRKKGDYNIEIFSTSKYERNGKLYVVVAYGFFKGDKLVKSYSNLVAVSLR